VRLKGQRSRSIGHAVLVQEITSRTESQNVFELVKMFYEKNKMQFEEKSKQEKDAKRSAIETVKRVP